jgi:hypothetical protein
MELKVLLFDRLSVVVAVEAPRLRTLESLLIASRMPEVSWDWSSIPMVRPVSVAARFVKTFASQSVEKMRDIVNPESWSTHREESSISPGRIIISVAFALESLLAVLSCIAVRYICLRPLRRVATGLQTRHASAIA